MLNNKIAYLVSLFVLMLATSNAQAIIIDFEDNAVAAGTYTTQNADVFSGGFKFDFASNHGHLSNDTNFSSPAVSNGSTYLVADDWVGNNPLTMSSIGGSNFDLGSLDLAEWAQSNRSAGGVNITGYLSGGGSIITSLNLDSILDGVGGVNDFQSFDLNWVGLTHVVFKGFGSGTGEDYFAIDNIDLTVTRVPEPGSIALMGLGLLAFGFRSFQKAK